MSPQLGTILFALGILGLFALDRDRKARTSWALWIAVAWLLVGGSRNVGQWLMLGAPVDNSQAYIEGDPVDRMVLGALVALGIAVLAMRGKKTRGLLRSNMPIVLFFLYCGLSSIWSDYSAVSAKRWIRALGDLVVVLLVLTEADVPAALKRLFARVGFLLLPLSILFIRYYPTLGRAYGAHDGRMSWTGVATEKNALGMICLIFGLASVWRLLDMYREPRSARRLRPAMAHLAIVVAAIALLLAANSVTSSACFVLCGGLMVLTSLPAVTRRPALIHLMVATVVLGTFCVLFLGIGSGLLSHVGRDSTLTGRTEIWGLAISLNHDLLLGAGFESFWLGRRLATIRELYPNNVNQVHNGYLEVFLNLGWVGVVLLATLLWTGYRRIVAAVCRHSVASTLMLSYFVVAIVYNFTEASFKMMSPVWIVCLLAITVPRIPLAKRAKMSREVGPRLHDAEYGPTDLPEAADMGAVRFRWLAME